MSSRGSILYILPFLFISLTGCKSPVRDYSFVRMDRNGFDTRDSIHFKVDMADTATTYNILFAIRADKKLTTPTIDADVFITSPTGEKSSTTISIPTDLIIKNNVRYASSHNGFTDIEWEWIKDAPLTTPGEWNITLLIKNTDKKDPYILTGIHELGINCKPNERKR